MDKEMKNGDHILDFARKVFKQESGAVKNLAEQLSDDFVLAVKTVIQAEGRVVVTGMGKAGIIGDKISATLSSTGTPSFALHPVDAIHGDLGRITPGDVVIVLSNSGETAEIVRLVPSIRKIGAALVAITARTDSTLAREADCVLCIGETPEACPLGLAPSASTTAMLAMGDALSLAVLEERGFSKEEFAFFHPGGSLGRKLMKVEELMRRGDENPVLSEGASVMDVIGAITKARAGAAVLTDSTGRMTGLFTDGDLRRYLMRSESNPSEDRVGEHMTKKPLSLPPDALVSEAVGIMQKKKIGEIPVTGDDGRVLGMVNLKDCIEVK